jgi:hypothetical protein
VHDSPDPEQLGLDPALVRAGVNLAGVLSPAGYDDLVDHPWQTPSLLPAARSVVVLASGGPGFFRAFVASEAFRSGGDPLDAFLVRVVRDAVAFESRAGFEAAMGFSFERRDGRFADFVSLGRAAGLGAPSRLAILVHAEYGPWFAIRAVLLTTRTLDPTRSDPAFSPCTGCPAPCAEACPGSALPEAGFDLQRCIETSRLQARCQVGCAARRACIVGVTHQYDSRAEAWHRRAVLGFELEG